MDEEAEALEEAKKVFQKTGGNSEIKWIQTMYYGTDYLYPQSCNYLKIPNTEITYEERNVLEKCDNNVFEIRKNIVFFLLRLYVRYFPNYKIYKLTWEFNHPDKPVDQTTASLEKSEGKWAISTGSNIVTNIYTIPYISNLFIELDIYTKEDK